MKRQSNLRQRCHLQTGYKMRKDKSGYNNRGQAVAEMAVFGSLILLVFGVVLSYAQRLNEQQYTQMECFRRAQALASSYLDPDASDGQGAKAQMTLIENRRSSDLSGDYRKGSPQTLSSSANVFWAVPSLEKDAEVPNLIAYRINQDEMVQKIKIPKEHQPRDAEGNERQRYWSYEIGDITTETDSEFNQSIQRDEDTAGVTNTNNSQLRENLHFVIPYAINQRDKDDEDYKNEVSSGTFWDVEQNLYRDAGDGQYKYSSRAQLEPVRRGKIWKTNF